MESFKLKKQVKYCIVQILTLLNNISTHFPKCLLNVYVQYMCSNSLWSSGKILHKNLEHGCWDLFLFSHKSISEFGYYVGQ